jgi:hypothetical protein
MPNLLPENLPASLSVPDGFPALIAKSRDSGSKTLFRIRASAVKNLNVNFLSFFPRNFSGFRFVNVMLNGPFRLSATWFKV